MEASQISVVILGCGYTGKLVASQLVERGVAVTATARNPASLADLARLGVRVMALDAGPGATESIAIPRGAAVLHSIPVVEGPAGRLDPTPGILARFSEEPGRMVYLSTTGVYGATRDVDETTVPVPSGGREQLRLDAERAVAGGPWSSLILRPAAIYGPDRGIQVSMRTGRFQLAGDGMNFVSRIHVVDLATHAVAGLLSDIGGAYPVADELACTSREIAEFCAGLLGVPMPASVERDELHHTRRADRRVDGRAIRRLLGISLKYPSYQEGIPASL